VLILLKYGQVVLPPRPDRNKIGMTEPKLVDDLADLIILGGRDAVFRGCDGEQAIEQRQLLLARSQAFLDLLCEKPVPEAA
jgi:hypothetical protein